MLDLSTGHSPYFWFSGHGMPEDATLPDIDRAYRELRPLFFGALGRLARQGFVTPPADGLDLIHDFFAEEWVNLQRTYDPTRRSYKAYAYAAFVQFVRPRIVRMQRLQNYKVRPDEIDAALRETRAAEHMETSHDDEVIRSKIASLPELQRKILTSYVYSTKVSERVLARTYSLSRYRLRELLLEALGRILVQLDRPEGVSSGDWQVALALWRDARTIPETAKYLAITEHQVRAANKRNFAFLTRVLSIYHPHKGGVRRLTMPREKRVLEPGALFKRALLSPNNEELLRKVKERAAAIMRAFDQPDDIDLTQDELKNLNPLWVARVYEAVAPTSFSAAYDENDHLYAHAEEEEQIGVAYKLSLMPGLPVHLADLSGQWLVKVPLVDKEEMNDVLNSPSAVAAEPLSRDLAKYGVAPLTVLDATDAVARLVERCVRSGRVNSNEAIVLSSQQGNGEVLNTKLLTDEVSRVAECREPTARVLLDWSIEVARFKPFLFDGFTAESSGPEALMLFRTGEKLDNLHERWGRSVSGTIRKQTTVEMYNVGQFRMDT